MAHKQGPRTPTLPAVEPCLFPPAVLLTRASRGSPHSLQPQLEDRILGRGGGQGAAQPGAAQLGGTGSELCGSAIPLCQPGGESGLPEHPDPSCIACPPLAPAILRCVGAGRWGEPAWTRAAAPSRDLGWGLLIPGPSLGSEDLGPQEVKRAGTEGLECTGLRSQM